jgi:Tol biopolymer transport system component
VSVRAAAVALLALAGCPLPKPTPPDAPEGAPRIVVAERGPSGGRLVVVAENGDRLDELATAADGTVRDVNPTFSPDGAWIAFASSRDRAFEETSLWVVAAKPGSTPVRVTAGNSIDINPAWTPDGKALVFASSREDQIDLYRQPLVFEGGTVRAEGQPVALTDLPGHELSPSVAADGRIAFTRIDDDGGVMHSRIAVLDGTKVTNVTRGPADSGPGWLPDGSAIAFTAPHLRSEPEPSVDGDLYLVPASGGDVTLLVDAPATDETGPVWSKDGRWLFATSIFRSTEGKPLFSSIVLLDRWEKSPVLRMLVDRAGAVPRLAVTLAPVVLDAGTLHDAPVYRDELAAILRRALEDKRE